MSTVGTITKLATEVVGKAAHAVTHPRQTVATVTGHARGLAATVTRGMSQEAIAPGTEPDQDAGDEDAEAAERDDAAGAFGGPQPARTREPAEPVTPAEPVEPSTTEPKAASRDAAHHGRGSRADRRLARRDRGRARRRHQSRHRPAAPKPGG